MTQRHGGTVFSLNKEAIRFFEIFQKSTVKTGDFWA